MCWNLNQGVTSSSLHGTSMPSAFHAVSVKASSTARKALARAELGDSLEEFSVKAIPEQKPRQVAGVHGGSSPHHCVQGSHSFLRCYRLHQHLRRRATCCWHARWHASNRSCSLWRRGASSQTWPLQLPKRSYGWCLRSLHWVCS